MYNICNTYVYISNVCNTYVLHMSTHIYCICNTYYICHTYYICQCILNQLCSVATSKGEIRRYPLNLSLSHLPISIISLGGTPANSSDVAAPDLSERMLNGPCSSSSSAMTLIKLPWSLVVICGNRVLLGSVGNLLKSRYRSNSVIVHSGPLVLVTASLYSWPI